MRNACTTYQHKLFDKIFGKDIEEKKVFFTKSEDGYDLYGGDPYWFIWTENPRAARENNKPWIPYYVPSGTRPGLPSPIAKFFKTEEGAKKWLRENLPQGTIVYTKHASDIGWVVGKYKCYTKGDFPFQVYYDIDCNRTNPYQILSLTNPLLEEPILL